MLNLAYRLLTHEEDVLKIIDKQDFDEKFLKDGKYEINSVRMWHYTYSYTKLGNSSNFYVSSGVLPFAIIRVFYFQKYVIFLKNFIRNRGGNLPTRLITNKLF